MQSACRGGGVGALVAAGTVGAVDPLAAGMHDTSPL